MQVSALRACGSCFSSARSPRGKIFRIRSQRLGHLLKTGYFRLFADLNQLTESFDARHAALLEVKRISKTRKCRRRRRTN